MTDTHSGSGTDPEAASGALGATRAPARLCAHDLTLSHGRGTVLSGIDLDLRDGAVTTVIGPNGCGKSTLLSALGRQLKPVSGEVLLDGEGVFAHRPTAFARTVATLPQAPTAPAELTVAELVARGRHPHQSWFRRWTDEDAEIVEASMAETGTTALAERPVGALSGGQRQRAWLAMVLAQQAPILLLDEPTTYLDLVHSLEILDVVRRLRDESSRTVVMVLHDLNLAARYSDRLVLLGDGGVVADGAPADVLTVDTLADVFRLRA